MSAFRLLLACIALVGRVNAAGLDTLLAAAAKPSPWEDARVKIITGKRNVKYIPNLSLSNALIHSPIHVVDFSRTTSCAPSFSLVNEAS